MLQFLVGAHLPGTATFIINATRNGEKNRPCNGLARSLPTLGRPRYYVDTVGVCYVDTLQVWLPAHWAPQQKVFFCSTLLRCDLLAKKVPGRAPYSQHIIIRNWT